jgi:membrane-associated phospholipid phosphatase
MEGSALPIRIRRFWPLVSAGLALLLVVALALVIVYREHNKPFGFELEWMGEILEHRAIGWTVPALVFNALGGGLLATIVIPVGIVAAFVVYRRSWAARYFAIAAIASVIVVQVLKQLIGRPRPLDILVSPDFGSFPSGHSANAALIATVLGLVFARTWVWIGGIAYTIAMMLSRTYLGAHWISDTIGGALVGAGVAVILWAPFALRLAEERRGQHHPIWKRSTGD